MTHKQDKRFSLMGLDQRFGITEDSEESMNQDFKKNKCARCGSKVQREFTMFFDDNLF